MISYVIVDPDTFPLVPPAFQTLLVLSSTLFMTTFLNHLINLYKEA